ncbi:hypothetical protein PROFUN_16821 [Planoprotostelium fungivorum]|uniref:Sialate O-acetylesterase domain-containing protein n=1 Tax=Planoprotostelium fungivorum TaxID=1890364 RepID=A0A2P6MNY8_9EUKA|nr:hypothetical protein PROFUN_16821 [Planoprotostelium fungivorum]
MPAGGPYTIAMNSGSLSQTLNNVLFGDVIVCAGGRNVDYQTQFVNGADYYLNQAGNFANVRLFHSGSYTIWAESSTYFASQFAAVCWLTAVKAYNQTQIPIGLIQISTYETRLEQWAPASSVADCLGYYYYDSFSIYNYFIAPILRHRISSVIWYQGEENWGRTGLYECQLPSLIRSWRRDWGYNDSSLPWLLVQLQGYGSIRNGVSSQRWAQKLAADNVPNVSIFTSADLSDGSSPYSSDRPRNKLPLVDRLTTGLLSLLYGQNLVTSGASVSGYQVTMTPLTSFYASLIITVDFTSDATASGLTISPVQPCDPAFNAYSCGVPFEISLEYTTGAPSQWIPVGSYSLVNGQLILNTTVPAKTVFQAWRYAWSDVPRMVLYNGAGLPTLPYISNFPSAIAKSGYYVIEFIDIVGAGIGPVVPGNWQGGALTLVNPSGRGDPAWAYQAGPNSFGTLAHPTGLFLTANGDCNGVTLLPESGQSNQNWAMIYTGLEDNKYMFYNKLCGWTALNNFCNYGSTISLQADGFSVTNCNVWVANYVMSL